MEELLALPLQLLHLLLRDLPDDRIAKDLALARLSGLRGRSSLDVTDLRLGQLRLCRGCIGDEFLALERVGELGESLLLLAKGED